MGAPEIKKSHKFGEHQSEENFEQDPVLNYLETQGNSAKYIMSISVSSSQFQLVFTKMFYIIHLKFCEGFSKLNQ